MKIILGCKGFNYLNQREVDALLERAIELGIFSVDTAPTYPSSERKIGNFLRRYPGSLQVSTKIFREENSISAKSGKWEIEKSLERLCLNTLETLYIHGASIEKNNIETCKLFDSLKDHNTVKRIGWCGTDYAKLNNSIEFDVVMIRVNPWDDGLSKLPSVYGLKEVVGMNIFANGFWRFTPWSKFDEFFRGHLLRQFNPRPNFYLDHPKRGDLLDFMDFKKLFAYAQSKLRNNSVVIGTNNPKHLSQIVDWNSELL